MLPAGVPTSVKAIWRGAEAVQHASAGDSVALTLDDELDVASGDLFSDLERVPRLTRDFEATLVWLSQRPAQAGRTLSRQAHDANAQGTARARPTI